MIEVKNIIRVAPAENRDEQDLVKELGIVRSNIKLFEGACQRLGALPNIFISAMAALAPPFISLLKEDSFGRLMTLMTAYLFKRVELGRGAKERLEYVQQHAEREVD
ncbi:hypothetical protein BWQ96_03529 [Gracilariopsis chorda]|uniref:Uncharacterized protein n=1 Tax=Gracilariopsis chorda TaxID=448386 RepID=A0A2V3IXB4_9FLOR|nr:hypothetical protein BWQ96_03529 [Gracilariopsis chorda]|eukprot:PXF46703.1 hypothetical protein BWQ96_03529 [Gracilariopsis chorda]